MSKPLLNATPDGQPFPDTQPATVSPDSVGVVQKAGSTAPADMGLQTGDAVSPQADAADDLPEISQAEARAIVEQAHRRLGEARVQVQVVRQQQIDTRKALANAISAWQAGAEFGSAEQRQAIEHRKYLAAELERKLAAAAAGRSTVPRMNTAKHPAFDPVTGRYGYKGNRRDGHPQSMQHRNIHDARSFQGVQAKKP